MGEALQNERINFMVANLQRTFGPDWQAMAYDRLHTRLRRMGINTVGAWSDNPLLENTKTPYTHILYVGRWPAPLGNNLVDPFSPKFEQSVEKGLRKLFPTGEDPLCVGVFIDNELGWYEEFVHSALAGPVGTHWFGYTDQSAAGRPGENYQIGFVDVTDTPYPEITATSRGLAEVMYSLAEKKKWSSYRFWRRFGSLSNQPLSRLAETVKTSFEITY